MPVKHYCVHHGKNATHDTDDCRTLETLARMNSVSNMRALTKTSKKRTHSPPAAKHDGKKQKLQQAKKAKDIKPEVKDDTLPKEKTAEEQARLDKKAAKNKEKKRKWHERWLKKQEQAKEQGTKEQETKEQETKEKEAKEEPEAPNIPVNFNTLFAVPLPEGDDNDLEMST